MTIPTNDDFSNRALSNEELETISAGNIFGDLVRYVRKEALSFEHRAEDWIKSHIPKFPMLHSWF